MEVHIGHCSSILNRLTCLHSSRVCHTGCQGQGCFAQEGEAEAEAREVAAEDRSREAGGAEARGGAETQGHGGGRGPAAPEGRPARAAGAGDGWTAGGREAPGSPAEPDERGTEAPAPRGGKDAVSGAAGQPGLQSQPPAGHRAAAGPADAAGGWRAVLTRHGGAHEEVPRGPTLPLSPCSASP
ncbi:ribosome biogenesis protein SLX9 homolog isoform X11 [Kogia breviceps]|uniref:ribosome biogenesis protein SLX9 homolog isoform X11 n=1 Tax=Kogia breviceps TaxID=27615 RepID=UPI0034D16451